jgi:hypothetical protein
VVVVVVVVALVSVVSVVRRLEASPQLSVVASGWPEAVVGE